MSATTFSKNTRENILLGEIQKIINADSVHRSMSEEVL